MAFLNRQAIETKYIGPSNLRGSRVKARADAGSVTVSWSHRLDSEQNHRAAAEMLANRLNWTGTWSAGTLPSGNMVFVLTDGEPAFTVHDVSELAKLSDAELLAQLRA